MVTNRERVSFGLCPKNSKSCLGDWHRWCFWSPFRHFGTHFAESFHMSKSSWMTDPACSREVSSSSAIDLAKICWSSKIGSWFWSVSSLVTVFGHPGRGTSQLEKLPHVNWATHFLMLVYDGAGSPNVSIRMREFPLAPCLAGKKFD